MQTKREQEVIQRISQQYGRVIDLDRTPGVMIEILREYGPSISHVLDGEGGAGGAPPSPPPPTPPSSIAIAGPGSGSVLMEDLMRIILDLRQEIAKLSERVGPAR
jgi:hypothetical protein